MHRPTKSKPRLGIEKLEAREVPATAILTNDGTLMVTGTEAADTITVRQTNFGISVDGVGALFPTSMVNTVWVKGLGGADTITLDASFNAVNKPAVIQGGDGDDIIHGGLRNDYIDGEAGNDTIDGDSGNDKIAGDIGNDTMFGGAGNDSIAGGAGSDSISGGAGADYLWGGAGFDVIAGGTGVDHVYDGFTLQDVKVNDTDFVRDIRAVVNNGGFGWFDAHLDDAGLRRDARLAARDGLINRDETIGLFKLATGGSVTQNEFHDLGALVDASGPTMTPSVRYLGQRIIDGDPANQWFTGGDSTRHALGDLHAGDTGDHLQKLIDKWYLGKDHPMAKDFERTTTYGYQEAAGHLFVDGADPNDVMQGDVGDCYFMSALGAVARQDPSRITNMFTRNGDGTYTVRLYHNGQAAYVTVDSQLPVDSDGNFVFANRWTSASDSGNELWVALAEKAYAQANESGWIGQDGTNSYNGTGGALANGASNNDGINGGSPATAMTQITNAAATSNSITVFADIRAAFDAGKAVVFSSKLNPPSDDVVENHAYMMVGYNATQHTVTLRNPWGEGASMPVQITLSFADLQANFDSWQAASI